MMSSGPQIQRYCSLAPTVLFLLLATWLGGQTTTYQAQLQSGDSLLHILQELEQRYDLQFAYPGLLRDYLVEEPRLVAGASLDGFLRKLLLPYQLLHERRPSGRVLIRPQYPEDQPALSGMILDAENNTPLPNVAIIHLASGAGSFSDTTGWFRLAPKSGWSPTDTILMQRLGYQSRRILATDLLPEQPLILQPMSFPLRQIVVTEPLASLPFSRFRVRPGKASTQATGATPAAPLLGADLFRQLQLLPGISTSDDRSTELRIRGSSGSETYILLDDIPLYHTDHYYGIFSAIQPAWVASTEVYPNNLPTAYDGRTGGMVIMEAPDSLNASSAMVEANTLTGSAQVQWTPTPNLGVQIAARSTWQSVPDAPLFSDNLNQSAPNGEALDRQGVLSVQPDYRFYDLHGKLHHQGRHHYAALSFFHSRDDLDNSYENVFRTRRPGILQQNTELFSQTGRWQNLGASFRYQYRLSSRLSFLAKAWTSTYQQAATLQNSFTQRLAIRDQVTRSISFGNSRTNQVRDRGAMAYLSTDDGSQLGGSWTYPRVSGELQQDSARIFTQDARGHILALFGQHRWQADQWSLTGGLRVSRYQADGLVRLAPRLRAVYAPHPNWTVKSTVGRHYQFVRQLTYENRLGELIGFWVLAGENDYPVGASWNTMLGTSWSTEQWLIDVEAYYKRPTEVMELAARRPGFVDDRLAPGNDPIFQLFQGQGRIFGMDVLLRYTGDHVQTQLGYTLSKSEQQFDGVARGRWFAAPDDRRHQLSLAQTVTWNNWKLAGNYIFTSGRPYTDVSLLTDMRDRSTLQPEDRQRRLPAYHRVDLGLSRTIALNRSQLELGFSVFNLLNRRNVAYRQYLLALPVLRDGLERSEVLGTQAGLLPRTFALTAKWQWP